MTFLWVRYQARGQGKMNNYFLSFKIWAIEELVFHLRGGSHSFHVFSLENLGSISVVLPQLPRRMEALCFDHLVSSFIWACVWWPVSKKTPHLNLAVNVRCFLKSLSLTSGLYPKKQLIMWHIRVVTHPTGKRLENVLKLPRRITRCLKVTIQSKRDWRCQRGSRMRAGTGGGLMQGVGKLCVGNDRRSYCAAFRRGSSEELASLAGAVGQEAPWQQQGQGAAITREALGWTETPAPAESVLSKPQSSTSDSPHPLPPTGLLSVTSEAPCSTEKRKAWEVGRSGLGRVWVGRTGPPGKLRPGLWADPSPH